MVLSLSKYENISKEEFTQELSDTNSSFTNNLIIKLTNLLEKFNKFTSKYDKLHSELQQYKKYNIYLLAIIIP